MNNSRIRQSYCVRMILDTLTDFITNQVLYTFQMLLSGDASEGVRKICVHLGYKEDDFKTGVYVSFSIVL